MANKHRRIYSDKEKASFQKLTNIICFILTVLFSLTVILQISFRYVVKTSNFEDYANNIDYSKITVQNGDEKLPFTEYINKYYVTDPTVTDDDIEKLLENSTASDYISVKLTEFSQYILGGSYKLPEITPNEIIEQVDLSRDMIYDTSPIRFLPDNHATLKAQLRGPLQSFNTSISESRTIAGFKAFISVALTIVIAVLLLITIVVWSVITARLSEKTAYSLRFFGIGIIVGSAIATIMLAIFSISPNILASRVKAVDISDFIHESFMHCAFIACIPLLVGFFITLGSILYIVKHRQSYIDLENSSSINFEDAETIMDSNDNNNILSGQEYNSDKNEVSDIEEFEMDLANHINKSSNSKNSKKSKQVVIPKTNINEKTVDDIISDISESNKIAEEKKVAKEQKHEKIVQNEMKSIKQQLSGGKHSDGTTNLSEDEIRKIAEAKIKADKEAEQQAQKEERDKEKTKINTSTEVKSVDNIISKPEISESGSTSSTETTTTISKHEASPKEHVKVENKIEQIKQSEKPEHIPHSHVLVTEEKPKQPESQEEKQDISKTTTIKIPVVKPDGTIENIEAPVLTNANIPTEGRKCPNCGKLNLSRNLFCSECGAMLK